MGRGRARRRRRQESWIDHCGRNLSTRMGTDDHRPAHAPGRRGPGAHGRRQRQGGDRALRAGPRHRAHVPRGGVPRGRRRGAQGRRHRRGADRRDPGGQAHRRAYPARPSAPPDPRRRAVRHRRGRRHGDARGRGAHHVAHRGRARGDAGLLHRRHDRLRHGQGDRAGRGHRAHRAAREDRREGGLPAMTEPLVDGHGRAIGDVRISVTDRCNFRCQYCMPAEGLPWLNRSELLSYEEITRLVRILAAMGVHDVRLTGGEPLVRRELWRLVERLSAIDAGQGLSLTTNGYLLARQVDDLVRAGLKRINVSLDSLAPDRFFQLTRRDSLAQVLEGLDAAEAHPELRPIKVNVVALKDFTEDEVVRFAEFARRTPYVVRFIEFMPLDADRSWSADKVLPNEEIRRLINEAYPLEAVGRDRHGTSRRWRFADGQGEIGFISPVSEPFCGDCNRIRLTAEGMLRTCLFSLNETDLREPMRAGASDADLEAIIRDAVWRKELKHHIGDEGFIQPARSMSRIGGGRGSGKPRSSSSRRQRRWRPSACRSTRPRAGSPPRMAAAPSTYRRSTARRWTAT